MFKGTVMTVRGPTAGVLCISLNVDGKTGEEGGGNGYIDL